MITEIRRRYPDLDEVRLGAELVRELISYLIEAVVTETRRRLDAARPGSAEEVRHQPQALVAFGTEAAAAEAATKAFLYQRMYRHARVMRIMGDAEDIICELFARYRKTPRGSAAGMVVLQGRGRGGGSHPPDCRFHRRNDRPFRHGRASAGFLTRPRICVRRRVIRPNLKPPSADLDR